MSELLPAQAGETSDLLSGRAGQGCGGVRVVADEGQGGPGRCPRCCQRGAGRGVAGSESLAMKVRAPLRRGPWPE